MSSDDVKALQSALSNLSDRLEAVETAVMELGKALASVTEKALRHDTFIGKLKVCTIIAITLLVGIGLGMGIIQVKDAIQFVKP